ncbi:aminotransferase class I/II-fold pyridoxal phosphate-dependent enzyme [Clostridium aestuarii]|uniref:Aminotransferase class I/II-fold pyridoxal phosphate-dependent enzyme n=1 Tax=Clostridium aestuarii TaxID=338193 RepID=A0ABT4D3F3_9CLOT|nr:aminotransferase class I/II-fold pyridoxal phosphate-dependent enzyme [Clostridium aestuarii]MCY6485775.1 aminotransferase class I/II-fold pyridoxal phosphate-dependent enzyme [Clostridium aestuarii]
MQKNIMTRLVRLGEKSPKSASIPKTAPIYMTSSFSFDDVETLEEIYNGENTGYIYSRISNPGHDVLKDVMVGIEEGQAAQVYGSGMAAITMSIISHVKSGDHIIAGNVLYGGSFQFLRDELKKFNIEVTFIDLQKNNIEECFKNNTKLVYVETISNPLMETTDIRTISDICHKHNTKLIVDNTFATPVVCQPLKLGADIVVYSATKYLCGHSDVMAGVVISDKDTIEKVSHTGCIYGPTMSPFDSWILTRSLRTLNLRVKQHSDNALKLAQYLQKHDKVKKVYYPGLTSSESYNLSKEIFNNNAFGGMLSVDLVGGEKAVCDLIRVLESIKFVPSLAGVATSLSYPVRTSHRAMNDDELEKAGISKGLLRISTGLENIDDIINEFDEALKKI